MRFPTPQIVARRVLLCQDEAGRNKVVYRGNNLNPRLAWGRPVLRNGTTLCFDTYIVPLEAYLDCIEATASLPADTPADVIDYIPDPHCKALALRELDALGGVEHQRRLISVRDRTIVKVYEKLLPKYKSGTRKEVALRGGFSIDLVTLVLVDAGIYTRPPQSTSGNVPTGVFMKDSGYLDRRIQLNKIVQQCRSNATGQCNFSLLDLYDANERGGYPAKCAVTGMPLNWDESMSWFSPRIGRYDATQPYAPGNVLIVSKLGRRLLDGNTVSTLKNLLKAYPEMIEPMRKWDEPRKGYASTVYAALEKVTKTDS